MSIELRDKVYEAFEPLGLPRHLVFRAYCNIRDSLIKAGEMQPKSEVWCSRCGLNQAIFNDLCGGCHMDVNRKEP
jgi:hypothetical protein